MLTIKIHNDSTGTQESANYEYNVYINGRVIEHGEIKGHNRNDGWRKLVQTVIDNKNGEDFTNLQMAIDNLDAMDLQP